MQTGNYPLAAQTFKQASSQYTLNTRYHQNLLLCLCFDKDAFPTKYLYEANLLSKKFKSQVSRNFDYINTKDNNTIRVGFVSGDFYNHPVGFFLENVLQNLFKHQIELFAYNSNFYRDDLTQRIRPYFNEWRDIGTLSDTQSAELIASDRINILIDLSGHTGNNRLSLFAFKPAPIQVSWLGYFASTGMDFIDYFIADHFSVSTDTENYFSEKIVYMPNTRLCFSNPYFNENTKTPIVKQPPVLMNNFITFGCFQGLSKINDSMLHLWLKILNQTPNSKILIKNQQLKDTQVQNMLSEKLLSLGYTRNQYIFEGGSTREEYLQRYEAIDIILDTFPYPGGTTTCEALWMGVPTITLSGKTLLERQGESILTNAGLHDWITFSEDDYVNKAILFSKDITKLTDLRLTLRDLLPQSPIMNASIFAEQFYNLLISLWRNYETK